MAKFKGCFFKAWEGGGGSFLSFEMCCWDIGFVMPLVFKTCWCNHSLKLCCKKFQEVLLFLNYCILQLLLLLFRLIIGERGIWLLLTTTFVNFHHHLLYVNWKMTSSMGWCKKRWHWDHCKCDQNTQCHRIDCSQEKACLLWCFFLVFVFCK